LEIDRNTQPPISNIQSSSQQILEQLEAANLFIVPLDDERRWYRYHHLFSDLLRNQLALIHPEQAPVLHQRASEWFEEEGFTEETIAHAFAARDHERVARLVEKYARDMLHQSKYNVLSSWIEALPDELVQKRPWLCVYQSWTRHWAGMRAGGEDCLKNAERVLNSSPFLSEKERQILSGYIATVRAHYALTNEEIHRVMKQAQKALRLLPENDYFTRGTAAVALGGAYWGMGDVLGAEQAFAECASNAMKGGYHYRASSALCYVGMQQVKQARLLKAEETFREALALSQGPGGRRFPNAGYPLAKLGELACEWNDLEQARRDAHDGVELCTQLGHVDLLAEAYVALARVQLARRDFAGVKDTLQRADRLSRETNLDPWAACWLDDCRLWLWLSMGKLDEAIRWAETSGLRVDGELNYHHDLRHTNLARVLVAQGMRQPSGTHLHEVLSLLARLLEGAEKAGWIHKEVKILILQALALKAGGDTEGAMAALTQALTLAKPGGYVRTFVDEGAPMGELLRLVAARGVAPDYISQLLVAFGAEEQRSRGAGEQQGDLSSLPPRSPAPLLIEPLSERELQVLRLLATRLSTAEIAEGLFIAVSTLRTHAKSIYGKLDVHSRREAVARAQELGLL
jgi:LuxR family maltose regulon positive regulatory protein